MKPSCHRGGVPGPSLTRSLCLLLAALFLGGTAVADDRAPPADAAASVASAVPDSLRIEHDLQGLNWQQFRLVVESVPKLKADVDAYGPLGWMYVKANYQTYHWKKNVDRLDEGQKRHLAQLIRDARR